MPQEDRQRQLYELVVLHTDGPGAIGMLGERAGRLGEPISRIDWLLEESARQKVGALSYGAAIHS